MSVVQSEAGPPEGGTPTLGTPDLELGELRRLVRKLSDVAGFGAARGGSPQSRDRQRGPAFDGFSASEWA
jgi:hypothetical protein